MCRDYGKQKPKNDPTQKTVVFMFSLYTFDETLLALYCTYWGFSNHLDFAILSKILGSAWRLLSVDRGFQYGQVYVGVFQNQFWYGNKDKMERH